MLRDLLDDFTRVWPGLRVSVDEDGSTDFEPWVAGTRILSEAVTALYVVQDEAMSEHFDEHAYELREDGLGPFAILFEKAAWDELPVEVLADVVPARLVGRGHYLVTVVTPDDETGEFTRLVLPAVNAALRPAGFAGGDRRVKVLKDPYPRLHPGMRWEPYEVTVVGAHDHLRASTGPIGDEFYARSAALALRAPG